MREAMGQWWRARSSVTATLSAAVIVVPVLATAVTVAPAAQAQGSGGVGVPAAAVEAQAAGGAPARSVVPKPGYAVTQPGDVRTGDSPAVASVAADGEDVDLSDLMGPVVGAPPEVVAAQGRLGTGGAGLRVPDSSESVMRAVTPTPTPTPSPTPNPTPTLRAGQHPWAPTFPTWIDPTAGYEAETTCDPVAKPGASDLVTLLRATYGTAIATNIVRACSSAKTGHKEGRAVDWMVNSRNTVQAAYGDAFVAWLLAPDAYGNRYAMARRLGVMYVIWRGRIFALYTGTWREYSHCLTTQTSSSLDNTCHRNHVHTSLSWAGARRKTSWWTMAPGLPVAACTPFQPATWGVRARATTARRVRWTRLLDTAAGTGTPNKPWPCAAGPNSVVGVEVNGRAGLPSKGIAAVQVRVIGLGRGKASSVTRLGPPILPRGVRTTPTQLAVRAAGATAQFMWVAVHPTGRAYLRVGAAQVDLQVDVVAWAPAVTTTSKR